MDAERFAGMLDAYGAEPRRWPAGERDAMTAFARTPDGMAAVATASALDEMLERAPALQPSPELRARVLAAAPRPARWSGAAARWTRAWAPGAGLAAAGLAGVMLGVALSGSGANAPAETLLAEAGVYDEAASTFEEAL